MKMGNIVTETNHMLYNSSVHKMILFVCSFAGIKCEKPSGSAMSNSQMIKWTVHPSKNNIKKQQQQPPGNNEQNLKNFSAICKLWRYAVFLVHFFSLSANFLLKCTKFEQVVQSKWQYFPFVWNSQYTKSEWYGVVWCGDVAQTKIENVQLLLFDIGNFEWFLRRFSLFANGLVNGGWLVGRSLDMPDCVPSCSSCLLSGHHICLMAYCAYIYIYCYCYCPHHKQNRRIRIFALFSVHRYHFVVFLFHFILYSGNTFNLLVSKPTPFISVFMAIE